MHISAEVSEVSGAIKPKRSASFFIELMYAWLWLCNKVGDSNPKKYLLLTLFKKSYGLCSYSLTGS